MFIANLTYIKSLDEVEKYLPSHISFLEHYYKIGKFICSGRKNPRTGGIILCNETERESFMQILSEDPFYQEQIANYEIIEFTPTKYADGFELFLNSKA